MNDDKVIHQYDSDDANILKRSISVTPGVYYPRNRLHRSRSVSKTRRIVRKNGEFNIERWKPNTNTLGYFSTWFVALVDARWRWTLFNFVAAFIGDWLFFGSIYWIIALIHGDLVEYNLSLNQNDTNWTPCIKNINGFTSTFLFSIEVHTTVAYGRRAITLECPQTIITMCLQCIVGFIFQAFMVGILFAKLTRPKSSTLTILFSKQLTISIRNEKLCLVFRVGDVTKSKILNIRASVFVLRFEDNVENMLEDYRQIELNVEMDGCESTIFLRPVSVIHVIDEDSPLYNISAADLLCGKIEILAVFEGLIESTGQPLQARTSYITKDILWGHRFISMTSNDSLQHNYEVDFSKLSKTFPVDTPLCSASEYDSYKSDVNSIYEDSGLEFEAKVKSICTQ